MSDFNHFMQISICSTVPKLKTCQTLLLVTAIVPPTLRPQGTCLPSPGKQLTASNEENCSFSSVEAAGLCPSHRQEQGKRGGFSVQAKAPAQSGEPSFTCQLYLPPLPIAVITLHDFVVAIEHPFHCHQPLSFHANHHE